VPDAHEGLDPQAGLVEPGSHEGERAALAELEGHPIDPTGEIASLPEQAQELHELGLNTGAGGLVRGHFEFFHFSSMVSRESYS
jgi:hypothetical protein